MADSDQLLVDTRCYACSGASTAQLLELGLMRDWLLRLNPMANTDPDALNESSKCYCGAESGFDKLKLGLLKAIALEVDPGADTDPDVVLESARCYACSGASIADLYELGLLQIIAEGS